MVISINDYLSIKSPLTINLTSPLSLCTFHIYDSRYTSILSFRIELVTHKLIMLLNYLLQFVLSKETEYLLKLKEYAQLRLLKHCTIKLSLVNIICLLFYPITTISSPDLQHIIQLVSLSETFTPKFFFQCSWLKLCHNIVHVRVNQEKYELHSKRISPNFGSNSIEIYHNSKGFTAIRL